MTVTGNDGTRRAAQRVRGIIAVRYKPDDITQIPAPAQKIHAMVVFFILFTPA